MIDYPEAEQIARDYIRPMCKCPDDEYVLVNDATIEKPYGWVFFYTSRKYLETQDIQYALFGNAPFLVEREDGSIRVFGTALPTKEYIKQYEQERSDPLYSLRKCLRNTVEKKTP